MDSPRRRLQFFTIAALMGAMFVAVPHAQAAARCYVDASVIGGANDGSSWTDAYSDLQSALADVSCTEIWVAAAIYKPTTGILRSITFQLKTGVGLMADSLGMRRFSASATRART